MMMTPSLLAKILKVWCWHDQSNKRYGRYVIWHHSICGQWPWAFLDGHFECNSMAAPTGLEFSISTRRFGGDVVSPWVTKHWANHRATNHHHRKQGWNTCILELFYSRKQKKRPSLYAALLTQWFKFFILFANWYVTRINARITFKTGIQI